ncbi:5880_t:CDS:2, partial [Racocetra persica]
DKFSDLSKNKIPKTPVDEEFEDVPKTSIKEEPDIEEMEDVKFPEINTVEEMTGVISGTIQMIKNMEDDNDIENFGDDEHWDLSICFLQQNNQPFDWNVLPANYQQITQLYRIALYYKKMIERVPTNPQITYQYIQNILVINEIKLYKKEEDII